MLRRLFNRYRFRVAFRRFDKAIDAARESHGRVRDAQRAKSQAVHAALRGGR